MRKIITVRQRSTTPTQRTSSMNQEKSMDPILLSTTVEPKEHLAPEEEEDIKSFRDDDDHENENLNGGDARRNWTPEVTLELARAWRCVQEAHGNLLHHVFLDLVYKELCHRVDCTNRSKKSIEGKIYGMKRMYQFITDYNAVSREKGERTWFELTPQQQREARSSTANKDPKISEQVFEELHKFLHGKRGRKKLVRSSYSLNSDATTTTTTNKLTTSSPVIKRIVTSKSETPSPTNSEVMDNGRNWGPEVTLELAKIWAEVLRQEPRLRGAALSKRVFDMFTELIPATNRSRKAVDDKMNGLKEMYRFIRAYNMKAEVKGTKRWFELDRDEQRKLRIQKNVMRYSNISQDVHETLDQFLKTRYDAMTFEDDDDEEDEAEEEEIELTKVDEVVQEMTTKRRRVEEERDNGLSLPVMLQQSMERQTKTLVQTIENMYERELAQRERQHQEQMALWRQLLQRVEPPFHHEAQEHQDQLDQPSSSSVQASKPPQEEEEAVSEQA